MDLIDAIKAAASFRSEQPLHFFFNGLARLIVLTRDSFMTIRITTFFVCLESTTEKHINSIDEWCSIRKKAPS